MVNTIPAHARSANLDLVNARLAPDMFTLAKQVQVACDNANEGAARLAGQEPPERGNDEKTIAELQHDAGPSRIEPGSCRPS